MPVDLGKAKAFIAAAELMGARAIIPLDAATEAGEIFDQAKNQAQVVGSTVFSFAQGVDAIVREAISDSALLAQLVANKRVSFEDKPLDWFKEYSEVLQNIGWTLQAGGWSDYTNSGNAAEVNEQVMAVMTAALGPGAAALAIITSMINALKAMQPGSSWLTIFRRESEKGKLARFSIGLAEIGPNSDVFVSSAGCLLEAESSITQVLFFKWRQANATFRVNSSKVSIDRDALGQLGPDIRTKIRAYQADYLSNIKDI